MTFSDELCLCGVDAPLLPALHELCHGLQLVDKPAYNKVQGAAHKLTVLINQAVTPHALQAVHKCHIGFCMGSNARPDEELDTQAASAGGHIGSSAVWGGGWPGSQRATLE